MVHPVIHKLLVVWKFELLPQGPNGSCIEPWKPTINDGLYRYQNVTMKYHEI